MTGWDKKKFWVNEKFLLGRMRAVLQGGGGGVQMGITMGGEGLRRVIQTSK